MDMKERITVIEPLPAALHALVLNGTFLKDGQRLSDCGAKEGDNFDFVPVSNPEEAFAQQLVELLQARDLTPDEVALMYTYKHGVTTAQALDICGRSAQLVDFLDQHKLFALANGRVKVVRDDDSKTSKAEGPLKNEKTCTTYEEAPTQSLAALEKFVVVISVTLITPHMVTSEQSPLHLTINADESFLSVKDRTAAAELIPFSDRELAMGGLVLKDDTLASAAGVLGGSCLDFVTRASEMTFTTQLAELLQAGSGKSTPGDLSLRYSCRFGASVVRAMKLLGMPHKFKEFLVQNPRFLVERGCVALAPSGLVMPPGLPPGLPGPTVNATHAETIEKSSHVVKAVMKESFLRVRFVTQSAGMGVANGGADTDALLFLDGLHCIDQKAWLPGVLWAVAGCVQAGMNQDLHASVVGDAVRVSLGSLAVDFRFASVC